MSGTSISSLILFIAAMLVAAAVAGTLVTSVTDISGSIDTHSGDVRDEIDTDIEIISDAGSDAVYAENEDGEMVLTLLVKNTGERTLSTGSAAHDVLVNGEYVTDGASMEIVSDDESWRSGAVAELEIVLETDLEGENRVVVDVGGDREVFEFYYDG